MAFERIKVIYRGLTENFGVGLEADCGSAVVRGAYLFTVIVRMAAVSKTLLINVTVLSDLNLKPLRKGVDN